MFNRFALTVATLALFSAAPAFANGLHADKGASMQGPAAQVGFGTAFVGPGGITETPFNNTTLTAGDPDAIVDVFGIPLNFESGTTYTMTFTSVVGNADGAVYGIFDCNNGSNNFAISSDSTPKNIGGPCTAEDEGNGDQFVNFNQVGSKVSIQFQTVSGQTPPGQFFFWTTDGNLTDFAAGTTTGTTPEPATYTLLGAGLLALTLLRRRTANNLA
jgi:PEP-CTERM motif-containing protein